MRTDAPGVQRMASMPSNPQGGECILLKPLEASWSLLNLLEGKCWESKIDKSKIDSATSALSLLKLSLVVRLSEPQERPTVTAQRMCLSSSMHCTVVQYSGVYHYGGGHINPGKSLSWAVLLHKIQCTTVCRCHPGPCPVLYSSSLFFSFVLCSFRLLYCNV